jgi:WD40 repeat protein
MITWHGHNDAVSSVAYSPDGTVLATGGSRDGAVRLWRLPSGKAGQGDWESGASRSKGTGW